jgi:hypothetical protein
MEREDERPEDEVVVAPGGPLPRSRTHHVPAGYVVRADPDGSLHVVPAAEAEQSDDPD